MVQSQASLVAEDSSLQSVVSLNQRESIELSFLYRLGDL